jgi:hypothetical protein
MTKPSKSTSDKKPEQKTNGRGQKNPVLLYPEIEQDTMQVPLSCRITQETYSEYAWHPLNICDPQKIP